MPANTRGTRHITSCAMILGESKAAKPAWSPVCAPFVSLSVRSSRNSSATSPSLSCFKFALYQSSPCDANLSSQDMQPKHAVLYCEDHRLLSTGWNSASGTLLAAGTYLHTPSCPEPSILQNRLPVNNSCLRARSFTAF